MPIILSAGSTSLVIVDENNLRRVGQRDPLILDTQTIMRSTGRPVERVIITFGNEDDVAEVSRLVQDNKFREALRYACRGVTNQPEDAIGMVRIASSANKVEES